MENAFGHRLFVDMDGVLADFDSGYHQRFGIRPSTKADNVDWDLVRATQGFYEDLPPMPDFSALWDGIRHLNPTVLTGIPKSVEEAAANKRAWVAKWLGPDVPVICCLSAEKYLHARPGDVLIDDWEKYRYRWESMGGRWITHTSAEASLAELAAAMTPSEQSFQAHVQPWMMACFGAEIAADRQERNHRFIEEALELVQACGCTQSEAHQLVDYVYGRPQGEINQEVGGVMVTLAALCLANGFDMHSAGETELARIWTKVDKIRAKQAAKPKHSPLPEAAPGSTR